MSPTRYRLPLCPTLERVVRNFAIRDQVGPVLFDMIRAHGSKQAVIEHLDAQPQDAELLPGVDKQIINGNP